MKHRLKDEFNVDAPGPLLAGLLRIDEIIPGSMLYEDALAFSILLQQQAAMGVSGDILEIGTLNGKTAAALGLNLGPEEKLHVCDLFEVEVTGANDAYKRHVSEANVRHNILVATGIPEGNLVTHAIDSRQLSFSPGSLRFVHVDGDHRFDGCLSDLLNAWDWLAPFGILAVDDYNHPDWPEVGPATDHFLRQRPEARPIADFNRRGARGRKLVLAKRG
ncbi:MAG: class I SAM-dependent methyltransferase [Verrucomicrobiaceae bacterium]|nr:MAG: class I SAM-dependent methyltransferase [Verrucomicrobiaceae bacterium]